jgi:hypothetical protein
MSSPFLLFYPIAFTFHRNCNMPPRNDVADGAVQQHFRATSIAGLTLPMADSYELK